MAARQAADGVRAEEDEPAGRPLDGAERPSRAGGQSDCHNLPTLSITYPRPRLTVIGHSRIAALRPPIWLVAWAPNRGVGTGMGGNGPRVLMVEDEKEIGQMYRLGLTSAGIVVELVESASEALGRLRDASFDLVLLDIRMRGVSGLELLARLGGDQDLRSTKVAMLSNYSEPGTVDEAKRLGAIEYFVKSRVTPGDLAARIRDLVSGASDE